MDVQPKFHYRDLISEFHPQNGWIPFLIGLTHYIDSRVSTNGRHSSQVARWARSTAQHLGCTAKEVDDIYWAARLHDLGKIGVPEDVLTKAGPLTDHEWAVMRLHPTVGANIVHSVSQLAHLSPAIFTHQERYDGSGYPRGLKGEEIPLGGRILAVVDAYDAMVNDRYYRKGRSPYEAARELRAYSNRHFDPRVVNAFLTVANLAIL